MSKQISPANVTDVLDEAATAAADFGAAADLVDEAAAAVLNINRTDLRIVGLVAQAGPLSAGSLATAAGLSPGATSTAIQRLATAGLLTREVDGADRRRAVVALTATAVDLIERIYGPIAAAGRRELGRYSPAELGLIVDFLHRGRRLQLDQVRRIRALSG